MANAAISDVKARLSHYLRVAQSGDEVTITDRGRPVARIVAIHTRSWPEHVVQLARDGAVVLPERPLTASHLRKLRSIPRPQDPQSTVRAAVTEERDEGDR